MDILLVDDEEGYLQQMATSLTSSGYNVYTATDGIKGCKILAAEEIDLIISDVGMPGFDGLKLHKFVREMDRYKQTKFVFLSASPEETGPILDLDPKKNYYVNKSFPPERIVKFVDKLLFGRYAGTWV